MQIRYGYRIEVICEQPTAMLTLLDIHPSRRHDLIRPDQMRVAPLATQPAPISMSPWKPTEGTPTTCRSRTPRAISARMVTMEQPE